MKSYYIPLNLMKSLMSGFPCHDDPDLSRLWVMFTSVSSSTSCSCNVLRAAASSVGARQCTDRPMAVATAEPCLTAVGFFIGRTYSYWDFMGI